MQRATQWIAVTLLLAGCPTRSLAQTAAPAAPVTSERKLTVSAGYEAHRDRTRYEFENPSNFDTSFLVPHRFVQTYVADNQWLVVSARYPGFGDVLETEVGLTPHKTTFASDLDTFFNPNDDVIVAGTAGDVSMYSWRFAQWSQSRLWGVPFRVGFVYRRDESEFHSTERLVTHSNPPSETRTPISTHETTISQGRELSIGVSRDVAIAPRWLLTAGVDVAPLVVASLTTVLPEKYPGQDIVFQARAAGLTTRLELARRRTRWPVAVALGYGRTWSYSPASRFGRDTLQFGVRLGIQP